MHFSLVTTKRVASDECFDGFVAENKWWITRQETPSRIFRDAEQDFPRHRASARDIMLDFWFLVGMNFCSATTWLGACMSSRPVPWRQHKSFVKSSVKSLSRGGALESWVTAWAWAGYCMIIRFREARPCLTSKEQILKDILWNSE